VPNPNVTVLEWLNQRPALAGQVIACAAWQAIPAFLYAKRSGLTLWATGQHSPPGTVSPPIAQIEQWMDDIPSPWATEHFDAFVHHAALDFIDTRHPRVLYVAFGEPDEWGHARRYDRYLESLGRCDRFIRELWEQLQSMPQYQGTTTLIISPDHGRGATPEDWINHGRKAPRSAETWLAVLGPDTPPLGERRNSAPVTQAQIAATIAQLLGEDYRSAVPDAAAALSEVIVPSGK
jgi:arylsulfatase A-like enzyme